MEPVRLANTRISTGYAQKFPRSLVRRGFFSLVDLTLGIVLETFKYTLMSPFNLTLAKSKVGSQNTAFTPSTLSSP